MSEKKLTNKQQAFVNEYLIDKNGTQAAIRAGYSPKTAQEIASENLLKPIIKKAVEEGLLRAQKRTEITVDDLVKELDENRAIALACENPQTGAANQATLGKAKLLGLVIDKVQQEGSLNVTISTGIVRG